MKKEYDFSQGKRGAIELIPLGETLKEYIQHHQESVEEVVR